MMSANLLYGFLHVVSFDLACQVLLYNFFEDSTMDVSQWRVVLNALPPEERSNHPAPRFDDARHSGICRDVSSTIMESFIYALTHHIT